MEKSWGDTPSATSKNKYWRRYMAEILPIWRTCKTVILKARIIFLRGSFFLMYNRHKTDPCLLFLQKKSFFTAKVYTVENMQGRSTEGEADEIEQLYILQ